MKRVSRKAFALLAVVGALFLLIFELTQFRGDFASWFWIVVAMLVLILGGLELFMPKPPPRPDEES